MMKLIEYTSSISFVKNWDRKFEFIKDIFEVRGSKLDRSGPGSFKYGQ